MVLATAVTQIHHTRWNPCTASGGSNHPIESLRPAAVKAGILSSHRDSEGRLVDDDPRRFGFHNLRHSLASFLIQIKTDPETVQTLLRHSDIKPRPLTVMPTVSARNRMAAEGPC
jgi:integrase